MPDVRNGVGHQVVLDLYECRTPNLDNLQWMRTTILKAAEVAGARTVTDMFHRFSPYGISGVVVISESHLAVHVWPEHNYAAIDMFTCTDRIGLTQAADYLVSTFESQRHQFLELSRGIHLNPPSPESAPREEQGK